MSVQKEPVRRNGHQRVLLTFIVLMVGAGLATLVDFKVGRVAGFVVLAGFAILAGRVFHPRTPSSRNER